MRFLCLLYAPETAGEALEPDERRELRRRYGELERELRAAGTYAGGAELAPAATATTVRVREGETLVTDGPFTETREHLGGFFELECADLEEALAVARRIPAAERGAVEVRPQYLAAPAEAAA